MKKHRVLFIILGVAIVLLIAIAVVYVVTGLPRVIPSPKATVSDEPYVGKLDSCDGLSISIDPDSVTPISATLVIYNNTGCNFSNDTFTIQKFQNGQWYQVNSLESFRGFAAMGTEYPVEEAPHNVEIYWEHVVGRLTPGHYRLLWQVYSELLLTEAEQGLRDYPSAVLSAEFNVK